MEKKEIIEKLQNFNKWVSENREEISNAGITVFNTFSADEEDDGVIVGTSGSLADLFYTALHNVDKLHVPMFLAVEHYIKDTRKEKNPKTPQNAS